MPVLYTYGIIKFASRQQLSRTIESLFLEIIRNSLEINIEIVWKRRNFFCLCYVPALTSAQSFRKGTKSSGNFNNISLNIKYWKKYHLSLDYVSKYPKALLNEIVMNKANSERNSKRRKDTNEESPKKYFCL